MNRDQFRGITLAALMILSVFAGATAVSAAGDTEVNVNGSSSLDVGSTQTYSIFIADASDGVQGYSLSVNLSNPSAANIVNADDAAFDSPSFKTVNIADDNSSAYVEAGNTDTVSGAPLQVATVTVEGVSSGSTAVEVNNVEARDGNLESYTVTGTNPVNVQVGSQSTGSADFQVSGLSAPSSVTEGDTVTATATISNEGDASGTQTVEFQIDGLGTVDSTSVSLDAGSSQQVSLSASTNGVAPGTYTHGIYTENDSQTAQITVEDSGEPDVTLPDDADAALNSGSLFWQGQQLFFQEPDDAGTNYVLYRTGGSSPDFVTQVTLDSNGEKILDTGRDLIGAGEYILRNANGENVVFDGGNVVGTTDNVDDAEFTVRQQTLQSSLDSNEVTKGDSTSVSLTSTRGTYTVEISEGSLEQSTVSNVFGASSIDVSNTNIDLALDTSSLDPGTYQFNFSVADTTASASVNLTVNEQAPANIGFAFDPGQSVRRGNFLELPVTINNTDTAQVRVGNDDVGYNVTATLTDGNGDGQATLRFNTYLSGFSPLSNAYSTANSADSVSISAATSAIGSPIDTGTYDLTLIDPSSGEEVELSSFLLQERNTGVDMQLWTAPRSAAGDISERSDVTAAISNGTVTPSSEIAAGDLLIHQIEVNDFAGVISAVAGDSGVATLTNAINNNVVSLSIKQTEDSTGINQNPKTLDLGASADALTVFYNADNDELYVVADTAGLQFTQEGSTVGAEPGDVFDVTFDVTDQYVSPSGDNTESVTRTFTVEDRSVALTDSDELTLAPESGQTITGEATVAPGSQYSIEIRGPNLLDSSSVTVGPNGSFGATFDLSRLSDGDELTATLTGQGTSDQVTYTVETPPEPTASVSISDQTTSEGRFVTVDSVNMSQGGFIAIHQGSASGDVIGASNYIAGDASNVAIRLDSQLSGGDTTLVAMAHLDTNGNEIYEFGSVEGADGPYVADGAPVTDSATVTVPTPEPTPTETTTTAPPDTTTTTAPPDTTTTTAPPDTTTTTAPPDTTTTTAPPDTTTTTTTTDDSGGDGGETTTTGDGPGFGVFAAVFALIAAALLAVRRNN